MPMRLFVLGIYLALISNLAALEASAAEKDLIRVLVAQSSQLRVRADGKKPLYVSGFGFREQKISALSIKKNSGKLELLIDGIPKKNITLAKDAVIFIRSRDPRGIWLGPRRYRGSLKVFSSMQGLQVVNSLSLENYLKSVVGGEMPKTWPIQALMAQAVAARTYALKHKGKNDDYDLKASIANQEYLGIESETTSTKKAVERTRSLVLLYKGKLIDAVFHSSSGGRTEASGDVWKHQFPYLRSVLDFDQHSPNFRWNVWLAPKDLALAFKELEGVHDIEVMSTSRTGRISKAKVLGSKSHLVLTGIKLRKRLGLKSTLVRFVKLKAGELPPYPFKDKNDSTKKVFQGFSKFMSYQDRKSLRGVPLNKNEIGLIPLLSVEPPPPVNLELKNFHLLARGFGSGHGVGLSQWGAHGLALQGASFRKILSHYYPGVKIRSYK